MSQYETVLVDRQGDVAVVTLNRPGVLNAFDATLRGDLLHAAREVNADDTLRVVVLTGAGGSFSAGADLSESKMDNPYWRVDDELNYEYKPIMLEIAGAPKPWISAVSGPAAGVGSAFAMVCDLSVMAEGAYLYQAFAAIGLVPDGGATWHLVRTLGRKRAYEVIVTGEKLSAEKCLSWGLCNRVVKKEALLEETLAWARQLAASAPLSLRYAKHAVMGAMERDLEQTISDEAALQHICVNSADASEGTAAFMEKRSPVWKGR